LALNTSLPQIRNGERSRSKLEEHLTSARCLRLLWSAPCTGRSCLVTPACSKSTDCTQSPVSHPRSAGMLPITPCTHCAWQCHSDCETTCHTCCCCTGRGRNKYRDVYTQRGVTTRRHRTPCILTLFASTHNMNMCVSSNSHKYMWTQTVCDEYERPKMIPAFICSLKV